MTRLLHGSEKEHPSFGTVGISRVTCGDVGGGKTLFDSPFRHGHVISLTVCHASARRDLNNDYIHSGEEIVRVYMSEVQFAQMLTSPNMGSGVPCTIDHIERDRMPEAPQDNTRETFTKEINEDFNDLASWASDLEKLAKQSRWNAADKNKMRELAGQLQRTLNGNLTFFQEQFEKKMSSVVAVARAEVEAHVGSVLRKAGMEHLKSEAPKLIEDDSQKA